MKYSPLAIRRRNILGDIYGKCEPIESIPVYLEDKSTEPIGHADESLGRYADAFVFHLPEEICKKLSTGSFQVVLDSEGANDENFIKLNHIVLITKQLQPAVPRRNAHLLA